MFFPFPLVKAFQAEITRVLPALSKGAGTIPAPICIRRPGGILGRGGSAQKAFPVRLVPYQYSRPDAEYVLTQRDKDNAKWAL